MRTESQMEVDDAELDVHVKFLGELCRVCGEKLHKAKSRSTSIVCNTHQADLKSGFSIDVERDDITQHFPHFCMSCYQKNEKNKEHTTPCEPISVDTTHPRKHMYINFLYHRYVHIMMHLYKVEGAKNLLRAKGGQRVYHLKYLLKT